MKELNLNINVNDEVRIKLEQENKTISDVAKLWILNAIEQYYTKEKANINVHKKFAKLLSIFDTIKEGIVQIDEDMLDWVQRTFDKAEFAVQKDLSLLLVEISNKLNEAKSK